MKRRLRYIAMAAFVMLSGTAAAAEKISADDATVTVIEGTAQRFTRNSKAGRLLKEGDQLNQDHVVLVGDRSRVEIRFPDGSVMRLGQKSRLAMTELHYDKQTGSKSFKVGLTAGKVWAKVRKLITPDSSVEVKTANAVAGVRGTVYRVNVEEDKSSIVKVYDGSVYVANPPRDAAQGDKVTAPHEVSGPREVPPPYHEVSREEWTAIVMAMQQITIPPQGVPAKPEEFDPKADADDWVKWNQARDKDVQF